MQRCVGVDFALMVDRMKFWFDGSTTTDRCPFRVKKRKDMKEKKEETMNRERTQRAVFEPVDLMAAVGIVATIWGALLFFLSTEGEFQTRPVPGRHPVRLEVHDWMQPAIGRTLTAVALLEWRNEEEASHAVRRLKQMAEADQVVRSSINERLQHAVERVNREQADKNARVEFVKGRSIVTFTSRMKKNGSLPENQWPTYNGRMIDRAAQAGSKIEQDVRSAKENQMREALLAETESHTQAVERSQERVGDAIVHVAMIEYEQRAVREAVQEQVGSLLSAASRTEL